MILKKQDLIEFARRTSHIKANTVMPILGYLLFESNTITKTNLSYYAKHTISTTFEAPVLIEETVLYALVNNTNESEITISLEGNLVLMKAGKLKQTCEAADIIDFPKFPMFEESERTTLGKNELQALSIAANFADSKETNFRYIYSTENDVFATDNFVMYFKQFDKLPVLQLTAGAARIAGMYEEAVHFTNNNIDFFECGATIYGFVRSDTKPAAYYHMMSKFPKANGIKLDKEIVQQFCSGAIALSRDLECVCRVEDHEQGVIFTYENSATNKSSKLPVECDKPGGAVRTFAFDAKHMLNALSTPYDYVWLNIVQGRAVLYNEDDTNYMGFIGEKI